MHTPKRNKVVKIRLTDEKFAELNRLKTRAELARWIRETALGQTQKSSQIRPKVRQDIPPEIIMTVAGIGNNLNQIAKQLNAAAKYDYLDNGKITQTLFALLVIEKDINSLREFFYQQSKET